MTQKSHRTDLIDPKIKEFGGRIGNTAGDSLLVEFPSLIHALSCSLDIRARMRLRNMSLPPAQRIQFRIGVNVGDVTLDDGHRISAAVAAVTSLLNFGLSTAFLFGLFARMLGNDG